MNKIFSILALVFVLTVYVDYRPNLRPTSHNVKTYIVDYVK